MGRHGYGGYERQLVVSNHPTEQVLDPPPRPQRPQRARPHRLISGTNPSLRPSSPLYSFDFPLQGSPTSIQFSPTDAILVCCRQENGTKPEFGLAPQGVEQARAAGEQLRKVPGRCLTAVDSWIGCAVVNLVRVFLRVQELEEIGVPVDSVKIRYSPFSRTTETARVVATVLGIPFEGPSCEVSLV